MSMTCATSLKVSSGSALTNMIFSARVLKMSLSRPSRFSQVTSSWLIFRAGLSPAPLSICTTMVRSLLGGCCCLSLGGWGTSASRPLGCQRRNHHEDDEQHQQNVDQRGYVDVGRGPAGPSHCHSHKIAPLLGAPPPVLLVVGGLGRQFVSARSTARRHPRQRSARCPPRPPRRDTWHERRP